MQCNNMFGNNKVSFPINFDIKIIMYSISGKEINKNIIKKIMDSFSISHTLKSEKYSSNGKYISYTANITVNDKAQMDALYLTMKETPEIKYAL